MSADTQWLDEQLRKILNNIQMGITDNSGYEDLQYLHSAAITEIKQAILDHLQEHERLARIDELEHRRKHFEVPEQIFSSDGKHKRPAAEGRNKLKALELASIDKRIATLKAAPDTKQEDSNA